MNKEKIRKILVSILCIAFVSILIVEIIPGIKEKNIKSRVFKDMQKESSSAMRGIIGIIPESEIKGQASHNGIGSGVIFAKKDDTYYAVTAKHVVEDKNNKYKVFTRDTKFSGETVRANPEVTFEIPDKNYYDSLLNAKLEYNSETNDLSIISFKYDGNLEVLEFATKNPAKKDKIMVIGHPEGDKYKITYGYIKSGLENIKTKTSSGKAITQKIIKHDAYMKPGNSGGVALNKNMKITGINVAGSFTLLGHFRAGYMIPYNIVQECIKEWEKNNNK